MSQSISEVNDLNLRQESEEAIHPEMAREAGQDQLQDQDQDLGQEVARQAGDEADHATVPDPSQRLSQEAVGGASEPSAKAADKTPAEPSSAIELTVSAAEDAPVAAQAAPTSPLDEPLMDTPRVLVIGVGGAGGNAVNTMIRKELAGVEYLAANTDAQALTGSLAPSRLQLGRELTRGHGAGGKPEVGRQSAEESAEAIRKALDGAHMCFIAAGMGGGTGTGAAPAIAAIARDLGVLTVGVVTKPFDFEGPRRGRLAEEGVDALAEEVDTIIVIPNQNLFRVASDSTTFTDAFLLANEVLYQGVKGVTDLMFKPGLVNLDFSDVRAVMGGMGSAMMGAGEGEGAGRAELAAQKAVDNPLLDDVTLRGAKGVLINITGGPDLTLMDVEAAASRVRQDADPEADIFFGSAIEPEMEGRVRVSVVATGVQRKAAASPLTYSGRAASSGSVSASVSAIKPVSATPAAPKKSAPAPSSTGVSSPSAAKPAEPVREEPQAPRQRLGATAERPLRDPAEKVEERPAETFEESLEKQAAASPAPVLEQEAEAVGAAPAEKRAAPAETPVAGSGPLRSDDLVRRITQTMPSRNAESSAGEKAGDEGGETALATRPRSAGASRPARENGKFEIPVFLRRQPGR